MSTDLPPPPSQLRTERLVLRRWRDDDRPPFAAMNADPAVMEHFPAPAFVQQSNQMVDHIELGFDRRGYGLWAVEIAATGEFIGFTGLAHPNLDAPFMPAVEIGWRLAASHWGHGYAPEAARAALTDGFDRLGLDEIVSFTTVANHNSRRVMEKLGMTHDPNDDFLHPRLAPDHRQAPHVLYRLRRMDFTPSRS